MNRVLCQKSTFERKNKCCQKTNQKDFRIMTDYFDSLEPGSLSEVDPLKSLGANGKPLERLPVVDQEIARLLALSQSHRIVELPEARSETIVYFIRRCRSTYRVFYERLFVEVDKRIVGTARSAVRGLD